MQAKPLSHVVQARLKFAKAAYNLTSVEFHPSGTYTLNLRNSMFHALTDQVSEHFGAIIHLIEKQQFFGSAFALLRPLLETSLRAIWTGSIASDERIIQIAKREKDFPKFSDCQAAVETLFAQTGVTGLYKMSKPFIEALHGFTHSGMEQITYRISPAFEVTPYEYPDESVGALLTSGARFTTMSQMVAIQAIEGSPGVTSPKVGELQMRFDELLRVYGV